MYIELDRGTTPSSTPHGATTPTSLEGHEEPAVAVEQSVSHWTLTQILEEVGLQHLQMMHRRFGLASVHCNHRRLTKLQSRVHTTCLT